MIENNEKPIILVVVTFFLAMTLVYIAFFRTQWNLFSHTDSSTETNATDVMNTLLAQTHTGDMNLSGTLNERIDLSKVQWSEIVSTWTWDDSISLPQTPSSAMTSWKQKSQSIENLKVWYWPIEIADTLWLSVKESFIDTGNTYYAYLGTGNLDTLAATVRRLWWNVLAIETEKDILKNMLRGDRIFFVNIPGTTFVRQPTEQKLLVVMIVMIGDDKWLVSTKINRYYASKAIMKKIFEQLYWKSL